MRIGEVWSRVPYRRFGWRAGVTLAGPLVTGMISVVAPMLSGCAGRSPAQAENREIRLTQDGAVKNWPRISPDGAWIAYARVSAEGSGSVSVYVIPRQGGEAR